jgi:dihydroorotate dehydrogenase
LGYVSSIGYDLLRKLAFRLDAETAHDLGLRLIAAGFWTARPPADALLSTRGFGVELPHPIGLAAGFDKNGLALEGLYNVGFSFVEVGTVTPQPQPGNEKPRMWRHPAESAIVNRLGFNSQGADQVARNLEGCDTPIPYGINIGKNKWTPNELAWQDYYAAARTLRDFGNYFVVNVSSPNTPGLRALQDVADLSRIVDAVRRAGVDKPLYVKVSPDQADEDLTAIAQLTNERDLAGIVATNTTVAHNHEQGGLSGAPLASRAAAACKLLRDSLAEGKEIIAVGGIFTGDDLRERLSSGAAVCQVYTSMVYRGPRVVQEILTEYLAEG